MNYRFFLIFLLFITSCATYEKKENIQSKKDIIFTESFSNFGFTLIYNLELKKQKKISKSIDDRSLIIFQKNLKKDTSVKITNLLNNKSTIAKVGVDAKYPNFYNSVISKRISEIIELDINEPYVQIKEINENSTFVANKAKTFDEEKNVANKAPVEEISIKSIGINKNKKKKKIKNKEFKYIIKIADLYFFKSAVLLKKRIKDELNLKNIKISEISKTNFRVYLGPYKNLNSLKKAFNDINKLEFENIEVIKL